MTYTWEKLHLAVHTLAGGGSIQGRLADACNFQPLHLDPDELPEDVRPVLRQRRHEFGGDDVEAAGRAISKLTEEQLLARVDAILAIHDAVARREGTF